MPPSGILKNKILHIHMSFMNNFSGQIILKKCHIKMHL